MTFIKQQQQQN